MIGLLAASSPGTDAGCTIGTGGMKVSGLCAAANSLHISVAYRSILPILVTTIGGLGLLVITAVLPKRRRPGLYPALTALIGLGSLGTAIFQWFDLGDGKAGSLQIGGQVMYDHFSVLFYMLISIAVILTSVTADDYLRREGLDGVEAYVLMLMSAVGAMLMVTAGSLIMLFLGLEIMSIALYVMAAYHRWRTQSGEAGLKYFILGSFSSAIFLYGIALVYGATGSVNLVLIANFLNQNILANSGVLLGGMALLIVGLGFKVAAVPFHFWTPDVYQGSPTPFTGYMAAVAKAAGFAALLRVLTEALLTQQSNWRPVIWVITVLTLLVGSVLALAQRDLKRMLAYSSISQAGYVLIGLQAGTRTGTSAALFYLFTYTFIVIGTFAILQVLQGAGEVRNDLGAVRGLGRRQPLLAAAFLILLLAQAGIPLTSGFLGKFYLIAAAVDRGQYWLAVIAMLAAALAAFFYLRVALLMYTGSPASAYPASASRVPSDSPVAASSVDPLGAVAADEDLFSAGLAPLRSFDGASATATVTALALEAPPDARVPVPAGIAVVLFVTVAFTIAAGVAGFGIDFARAATSLF